MKFDLKGYLSKKFGAKAREYSKAIAIPDICDGSMKPEKVWCYTETNTAYCFRCHVNYPLYKLIQAIERCTIGEAFAIIRKESYGEGIKSLRTRLERVGNARSARVATGLAEIPLPDEFLPYGAESSVPTYFRKRNIDRRKAVQYHLGYCKTGIYANRMVMPVIMGGKILGYQTRAMYEGAKRPYMASTNFASDRLLFNYDEAVEHDTIYIVEGIFDAIAVGNNAVATFGTHLSEGQIALLTSASVKHIVFAWDRDAYELSLKTASKLREQVPSVACMCLPIGRDPDQIPLSEFQCLPRVTVSRGGMTVLRERLHRV